MTKRAELAAERLRERSLWPLRRILRIERLPGRGGCWALLECDHKICMSPDAPHDVVARCRVCHLHALPARVRITG